MTVRDVYEAVLIEINKENAQSFTIEEFGYVLNKAILAFVNEKYNFYPVNQQLSDDLRVLLKKSNFNINDTDTTIVGAPASTPIYNPTSSYTTAVVSSGTTVNVSSVKDLKATNTITIGTGATVYTIGSLTSTSITVTPAVATEIPSGSTINLLTTEQSIDKTFSNNRTVDLTLPSSDYLHLVSCRTMWLTKKPLEDTVNKVIFTAKRLTFDMLNVIETNTYLRPTYHRPYHQVFDNNLNSGVTFFPSTLTEYKEYQNKPVVRIHVGQAHDYMELAMVEVDYLKVPEFVQVRDEDVFSVSTDNSQVLEFPNYLLNEIVKRCTIYLLEKASDQRIQTQPAFNQEIPAVPLNIQGTMQQQQARAINAQQQQ